MTTTADVTISGLRVRAVLVSMRRPLETSGAEVPVAPLVLIDLLTDAETDGERVVGRSYLFCYTPLVLAPLRQLVANLEEVVAGQPLAPLALQETLHNRFRLLRPQGLVQLAISGIDMAAWDARARAAGLPLVVLLGGQARPVPAYGSLKRMTAKDAADETEEEAVRGFTAYKVKVGSADVDADAEVLRAIRGAAGSDAPVAIDYNQTLSVPEAIRRARRLDPEAPLWLEEPTRADDFSGHAQIRRSVTTPVQIGENWWSIADMTKSLAAGASDFVMPDVARIGGVTGWLRAAALAASHGLPMSSHLYPEFSAHLLAVTPGAHLLEHLDVASPVLAEPATVSDGAVQIPDRPGAGLDWDEAAVGRYLVE